MTHFATSLSVIWLAGLLFLIGRTVNFIRLVYNNFAKSKTRWQDRTFFRFYFLSFRFLTDTSVIDPASLTEVGRQYRNRAIRNEWILRAWAIGGFILVCILVWAFSYLKR